MSSIQPTRIDAANAIQPAAPVATPALAEDGVAMQGDQFVRSQASAGVQAAAPFSFARAAGHFFKGFGREIADMGKSLVQHPLQAIGMIGAGALVVAAAPFVGITAATAGLVLAGGFAAYGAVRMGMGAAHALADYKTGDAGQAEADFEQIGRGAFDVASAVAPIGIAKGVRMLRGAPAVAEAVAARPVEVPVKAVEIAPKPVEVPTKAPAVVKAKVAAEPSAALSDIERMSDPRIVDFRGRPPQGYTTDGWIADVRNAGKAKLYTNTDGEGIELALNGKGITGKVQVYYDPKGMYTAHGKPTLMIMSDVLDPATGKGMSIIADRAHPQVQEAVGQAMVKARNAAKLSGDVELVKAIDQLQGVSQPNWQALTYHDSFADFRGFPPQGFSGEKLAAGLPRLSGASLNTEVRMSGSTTHGLQLELPKDLGFDGNVVLSTYDEAASQVYISAHVAGSGSPSPLAGIALKPSPATVQALLASLNRARAGASPALLQEIERISALLQKQ
ncbi:MAG: hypothetical protein JWM80_1197 [Cyanobacteria bacterium RYN_339]|nr:hypothetical protein [Cyanobacteria bacterium RYN_339]